MMKNIVLVLLAVLPTSVFAQTVAADNFTIKSKVGNLSAPAKAYMGYRKGEKNIIDSAAINNGEFGFHGYIGGPTTATIVIDAKGTGLNKLPRTADALNFYIEKGNILIASADSLSKANITGSKINDDNKRLTEAMKPAIAEAHAVLVEADTASDAKKILPDFANSIQRKYKVAQMHEEEILRQFIAQNPKSFVSLAAIGTLDKADSDPFEIEKLYNTLSPEIKATEGGISMRQTLDLAKSTAVGSIAPEFAEADTSGKVVSLSSLRGKYVLIDFWASWCGPCRMENPNVVKTYNKYKDKNFTIIGVSLDKADAKSAWLKAISDDHLNWTQVSDLNFWANQVAVLYKVSSIPQNYLIDPTGKIIAKSLRGADLEAKLAEVLK